MTRFAVAALAALGIVLAAGPGAHAQSRGEEGDHRRDIVVCTSTMTGGVVRGNLVVPTGAACRLVGVTVDGNVSVGARAELDVNSGSKIGGNIVAEQCNFVVLFGNPISVGGNLEAEDCTGQSGSSGWEVTTGPAPGITIGGNFACENNADACLVRGGKVGGNVLLSKNGPSQVFSATIGGNLWVNENSCTSPGCEPAVAVNSTVGGNVVVNDNSGPSGAIVGGNVIYGNLQCQGNTPGVTDGGDGPNTVSGNKLGQCAGPGL